MSSTPPDVREPPESEKMCLGDNEKVMSFVTMLAAVSQCVQSRVRNLERKSIAKSDQCYGAGHLVTTTLGQPAPPKIGAPPIVLGLF